MLFENNNPKRRKRSYYPFSKNYPSKSGNIYAIGESRTRSKKEKRNRVIFYCSLVVLFVLVFVLFSVMLSLSNRPIKDVNSGKASELEGRIRAVYMPEDALGGGIALSLFRAELTEEKANAVVIEFKDPSGMLHYNSSLETAVNIGAAGNAYDDANSVIAALKADGYRIIAKITCFEDTRAASMLTSACVKEADGSAWLDDSAVNNGNPWLNPYSHQAQDYLLSLISEASDVGADVIMLDAVCFPYGGRSPLAVFPGEAESTQSRNAVLHSFIKKATELCPDTAFAVLLSADQALNGSETLFGGGMFDSDARYNAVDMRMDRVGESIAVGGEVLEKSGLNENTLIAKCIPLLNEKLEGNFGTGELMVIVDDGIYTATLDNMGVKNYIIIRQ